jgi:biotin carboxylase
MMEELVIIVGGGIFQVPAIREAKAMGYSVLVFDMDPSAPGFSFGDHAEYISTRDIKGAIQCAREYAKRFLIRGVFTAGTDVSYTVACIAEALNLPGISPDVALHATNKYRMRVRLAEHNVPCPKFFQALSCDDACQKASLLGYPLVIKPVDNMGARGVRRIDNEEELREQFATSITFSGRYHEQAVIIEEYMDGEEISMDTLVDESGNIHLLTIADRHIVFPPYFVEIGHTIPSELPAEKLADAFSVMKQAIRAIGITRGAAKADIKITSDGAKIGEITARLSGGFHSQYTDPLATGMRSTKAALDIALGKPLDVRDVTPQCERCAIERAILPNPGTIVAIEGVEAARKTPGVCDVFLTKKIGDEITVLTSNIGKAGHIIASGRTREEAEKAYRAARDAIVIVTDKECVALT